jgi:hypothetical protein
MILSFFIIVAKVVFLDEIPCQTTEHYEFHDHMHQALVRTLRLKCTVYGHEPTARNTN